MARRKFKAGRTGWLGQKLVTTSLSESARSLTATVAALELDARNLRTRSEDFKVTNDEDSSVQYNAFVAQMSTPHSSSVDDSETDNEPELEDAPVHDLTLERDHSENKKKEFKKLEKTRKDSKKV